MAAFSQLDRPKWVEFDSMNASIDRGCVKTRKKLASKKIDASEHAVFDFLDVGNGFDTPKQSQLCVFTQPRPKQ
jgi:hypothetical protein